MWGVVLREVERRFQPYLRKLKLWQLLLLLIFIMFVSIIYLSPGGTIAAAEKYIYSISITPRALASTAATPLTEKQRIKLKSHISRLDSQLRVVYSKKKENAYMNAWAISQVGIAINDGKMKRGEEFKDSIISKQDRRTAGWKEFSDARYTHIPSTCWALMALKDASFDPTETLKYLISVQRKSDGAWAVYPLADLPENASTYATAWSLLALNTWLDHSGLEDPVKIRSCTHKSRNLLNFNELRVN